MRPFRQGEGQNTYTTRRGNSSVDTCTKYISVRHIYYWGGRLTVSHRLPQYIPSHGTTRRSPTDKHNRRQTQRPHQDTEDIGTKEQGRPTITDQRAISTTAANRVGQRPGSPPWYCSRLVEHVRHALQRNGDAAPHEQLACRCSMSPPGLLLGDVPHTNRI